MQNGVALVAWMRHLGVVVLAMCGVLGCGGSDGQAGEAPPGQDAGSGVDSGGPPDAGAQLDSGARFDVGVPDEAGDGGHHSIKWNPGHYMASDAVIHAGDTLTRLQWEMPGLDNDGIVGYRVLISRSELEPSAGHYDFSIIEAVLAKLKTGYQKPKHLVVVPFPGESWWDCQPIYRQAEMDAFIALVQALGARYDGDPDFEALMFQEDSWMVSTWEANPTTYPDFDPRSSALEDQLKRLLTASTLAFAHTNVVEENTWLSTQGPTEEFEAWMVQNRIAPGTADTVGQSVFVNNYFPAWGLASLMGMSGGGYTATDLRPKARAMLDVEGADLVLPNYGKVLATRVQDICNALNNEFWASHAFWNHLNTGESVFNVPTPASSSWTDVVVALTTAPECKLVHTDYPPGYPN